MEARRMGQAGRAVALLDALLARYPGTPLGASAEVERFRALQQAGRRAEAARAARRYLAVHPDGMGSAEARELAVERVSDPGGRGAGRDP
jgi:outer membrane protein assembly factor BamD (BamD/ComL family)